MEGLIVVIVIGVTIYFEISHVVSLNKGIEKDLDDQCKANNITDADEIKKFKKDQKSKNRKSAYRVLFYCFLPCLILCLYVWFLISLK